MLFSDGKRRLVTVSAAEAARLEGGRDLTTLRNRVWAHARAFLRRALPWIVGLLVGSLVLPALTKQWSDRQAASAIRQSIFQELDEQSTVATARAESAMSSHRQDERATAKATDSWLRAASRIDGRFAIYFPSTPADEQWTSYRRAVFDLILLSYPYSGSTHTLQRVRSYLQSTSVGQDGMAAEDWRRLRGCARKDACDFGSPKSFDAYGRLELDVLDRRGQIESAVLEETPKGFSEGWRDLVRDVVTFNSR
jgi:hypothetical protein